jgi:hypothetical protein
VETRDDGDGSSAPKNKGGRPLGAHSRLSKEAREKAEATGALPHELLLQWGRGEPMARKVLKKGGKPENIDDWHWTYEAVDADTQKESAKAAAPYYAPKISTVEVITGVSDADLDEFIARAAAEAGLGALAGGEGQAGAHAAGQQAQGAPKRNRL